MSADAAAAAAAPSTLDMYEVLGSIGKGSFGCVSKIRRKSDGRVSSLLVHARSANRTLDDLNQ